MIEILIVEDEKPISDLIRLNLMKAGYSCTCAFDGMEAADILEERNFDLIILDVMLMCGKVTHMTLDSSSLFLYLTTGCILGKFSRISTVIKESQQH